MFKKWSSFCKVGLLNACVVCNRPQSSVMCPITLIHITSGGCDSIIKLVPHSDLFCFISLSLFNYLNCHFMYVSATIVFISTMSAHVLYYNRRDYVGFNKRNYQKYICNLYSKSMYGYMSFHTNYELPDARFTNPNTAQL